MNALDNKTLKLLNQTMEHVTKNMKTLIVYNEDSNFSTNTNLDLALFTMNITT